MTGRGGTIKARELADLAVQALDDKKGENIVLRDLRGVSEITDYSVVVSGTSPPHLKALFNEVQHVLKQKGCRCYRKAGDPESGWMVLDYVELVIHIFEASKRDYYAIEDLWAQVPPESDRPS